RVAHGLSDGLPERADREAKTAARRRIVDAWFRSFDREEDLHRAIERAGLAWGRVRDARTLLDSPTIATRGIVAEIDDRNGGRRPVVQMPYRFSCGESGVRGSAAYLGEHNEGVLEDWLGMPKREIARLVTSGALRTGGDRPTPDTAGKDRGR